VDRHAIYKSIVEVGLVPIVRTSSADAAVRAVQAVIDGGINVIEVTMTVPGALKVLEQVASKTPNVILGAGTVLDSETARACILSGAHFLVTPALKLETLEMARRYSRPIMPGALTPTEVLTAWEHGADAVKIFPCSAVGGAKYIKALKAPLPQIEMVPTGGVNLETAADFLKAGASALGVGGELVDEKTIKEGRFDIFTERARKFVDVILQARSENEASFSLQRA
jgi:2-dehydro-3-deoxyphosphogluconate aldolase / (4S)-4-hydroxy-2-oxoglutarate aldolase